MRQNRRNAIKILLPFEEDFKNYSSYLKKSRPKGTAFLKDWRVDFTTQEQYASAFQSV